MLKPAAVSPGARVAVVAPASNAKPERIELGLAALRKRGFDAVAGAHALGKEPPFFSGTVAERLDDLHQAFADPAVRAIICTRGGYGSNYLLEDLDLDLVRANPKPFFGYSDLTTVQTWLLDQLGLVGFHGPMVAADFYREGGVHEPSFEAALSGGIVAVGAEKGLRILKPGRAQGVVYGGCLSILTFRSGHTLCAADRGQVALHRRRGGEAVSDRPDAAADAAGGQVRRRYGVDFRRNAGVRLARDQRGTAWSR